MSINRRKFIKNSALGVIGGSIAGSKNVFSEEIKEKIVKKPSRILEYRMLGRTGFKVSDISLGYSNNSAVIKSAIEAGVNYIDTAESYRNQPAVGEAIKGLDRSKIFITSKLEIKEDKSKESFIKRFKKCLDELKTDYIDCMMIHSPEKVETLKTPGFHEAMDQMKKEGKLKFVGVSNHGTNWLRRPKVSMEEILTAAANDGRFSVMLLAYNFIQEDFGAKVLELCKTKNIGTTLMKVNPVGKYYGIKERVDKLKKGGKKVPPLYLEGLENYSKKAKIGEGFIKKYGLENPGEIRDAAIRFCLDNQNVGTVACSMRNFDHIEDFVKLSGTRLVKTEKIKLAKYKEGPGMLYCRHACSKCEPSCPHEVPVNTIMRYNHYYEGQGKEKYAIKSYEKLDGNKADICSTCEGYCEKNCPYGVPVQGMLAMAHKNLSIV
ncbi:MAG: aldo/keto reductase [Acidobacteriota bacterium]